MRQDAPALTGRWKQGAWRTDEARVNRRTRSELWTEIGAKKALVETEVRVAQNPPESYQQQVARTITDPYQVEQYWKAQGPDAINAEMERRVAAWLEQKRAARKRA